MCGHYFEVQSRCDHFFSVKSTFAWYLWDARILTQNRTSLFLYIRIQLSCTTQIHINIYLPSCCTIGLIFPFGGYEHSQTCRLLGEGGSTWCCMYEFAGSSFMLARTGTIECSRWCDTTNCGRNQRMLGLSGWGS